MIRNNEDRQIASTKSEQLKDLLPLIFKATDCPTGEPLESLAIELIEDIAHAIRRMK